jgi:hypothetical protein
MRKNTSGQKWSVFAFDETDNTAKTGDAAQITAEISIDGAAGGGNIADTNPTELEDGYYVFDLATAETNGDYLLIMPESSTANIQVIGVPGAVFTTANLVDDMWDELFRGDDHNTKQSAADYLKKAGTGGGGSTSQATVHSGTAQAGTANTITLDTGALAVDNIYRGSLVNITGGTGVGQTNTIFTYVGSTRVATMAKDWITTPDATSTFDVLASSSALNSHEGVAQAGAASSMTLASTASANDDIYNGAKLTILSGTGSGQTEAITDYAGGTKVASIAPATWSVNPDTTSVYAVIPDSEVSGDTNINQTQITNIVNEGAEMSSATTWAAAAQLHASSAFGGTDAVLAADREYDYTADVDLETSGHRGAQVLLEAKLNFGANRGLGATAVPNDLVLDVFASLDGTTYDTVPLQSLTLKSRADQDAQTVSLVVKDVAHFRIGVKTTGTEDTFDYRLTHQRYF